MAALARANLRLAATQGAAGTGEVYTGDGRRLSELLPVGLRGRVALVLTSPPPGASCAQATSSLSPPAHGDATACSWTSQPPSPPPSGHRETPSWHAN